MPTLNRFPLLGLWAREAALRIGHPPDDAEALGHAYAVLYAIRANVPVRPAKTAEGVAESAAGPKKVEYERLLFGGDEIQIERKGGHVLGRVGDDGVQTPGTFRYKIASKFPAGYFARVEAAFREYLSGLDPARLDTRLLYTTYDQWKKQCAAPGRVVDLDTLLAWCAARKPAVTA